MEITRYFIVGTVNQYSSEDKSGIVLNAGNEIPFTLTDEFISENNLGEIKGISTGMFISKGKTEPIFALDNPELSKENILLTISGINYHDPGRPGHKHGVILCASDKVIVIEQDDPWPGSDKIKIIKPRQIPQSQYDELDRLGKDTRVRFWLKYKHYGDIIEAEEDR